MISLNKLLTYSLVLLVATTGSVFAYNIDILEGHYRARVQDSSVLSAYEVESVWTLAQAGKDRLEYLKREQKASCIHINRGLYRCHSFIERILPTQIQERIARDFSDSNLVMQPETGVELFFKGEGIEEYLVTQNGELTTPRSTQIFSTWRYFFGRNELQKIQAGVLNPTPYSFVREGDTLQLVSNFSMTLDQFRFQMWIVKIPFNREY